VRLSNDESIFGDENGEHDQQERDREEVSIRSSAVDGYKLEFIGWLRRTSFE